MTSPDDHSDDVALVGEYALHLLDAEALSEFETRFQNEAPLRQLVKEWDEELASLADGFAPVAPPARIKAQIEKRLFAEARAQRSGLSLWRFVMGAGFAAALGIAVLVVLPSVDTPAPFAPEFTAELAAEDQSLVVLASYAPDAGVLRIDRQTGGARPGRALELWLIADGATAPVSLGVLPEDAVTDITLPETLAGEIAGGTLAISDEPPGGSTTGAPTGDVLAVGAVTSI